jgi:hypothetical protein
MAANPGWTAVGSPVTIGPFAGRFNGGTLTVDVIPSGAVVQGVVICWTGVGASDFLAGYDLALAQGAAGRFGVSRSFTVDTGDPTTYPPGTPGAIYNSTTTPFTGLTLETGSLPDVAVYVTTNADSGPGSLRSVIGSAQPWQYIRFKVTGTIELTSGALMIGTKKTIVGPGKDWLTVSAGYRSRVFEVLPGGQLGLSDLTVAHGKAPPGATNEMPRGAGILNEGELWVGNCELRDNGQGGEEGGAIYSSGTSGLGYSIIRRNGQPGMGVCGGVVNKGNFLADHCIFTDNFGTMGGAIHGGDTVTNYTTAKDFKFTGNRATHGGAVFGKASLTNCTIALNYASVNGGGISGNVILESCTVSSNTCKQFPTGTTGEGGGIYGSATVHSTIIAGNTAGLSGPNVSGTLNSMDYNLLDNTNGATISGVMDHNIYGQDPKLGPLAFYDGQTRTMPLLSGSPAIDAGPMPASVSRDQRGRIRPYGAASDIGAFESSVPWVVRGTISGSSLSQPVLMLTDSGNMWSGSDKTYSFSVYTNRLVTITPSNVNYCFVPSTQSVTVTADQPGVDFKAYGWNMLTTEGVSNGVLHLVYAGNQGDAVRTLSSSNLVDWIPVCTNTVPATKLFDIFELIENPTRFYRTVKP